MISFILLSRKSRTDAHFSAASAEGALICRFIFNCLWAGGALRRNVLVQIAFEGPPSSPKLLTFNPAEMERFTLIEEELVELIQRALLKGLKLPLEQEFQIQPGLTVAKKSIQHLVKELDAEKSKEINFFYLEKSGLDLREADLPPEAVFVVGDIFGLPKNTIKFLERYDAKALSIGPSMVLASHCPVLILNEMDRRR